jgi:Flp pilus assembly protein TadD
MPVPCPCCKASNDTGPACRRCKSDLSLLLAVEDERASLVAAARTLAAESRHSESLAALDRAAQLRRTDDVLRLRAAVLLLARDFAGARRAYDELADHPGERRT